MPKVDALLDRLDKIRCTGDGQWVACCPAHADKTPSLSIRDTGEKVLIHCFAGCPAEEVLDAVELRFSDLYDDKYKAAFAAACAYKGRKFKPLKSLDPLELERRIIKLGESDLKAGVVLSTEDRARLELAIERVNAAQRGRHD